MSDKREVEVESLPFGTFALLAVFAISTCSQARDVERIATALERIAPAERSAS